MNTNQTPKTRKSTFTVNGKNYIVDWDKLEAQKRFYEQKKRELHYKLGWDISM